jgi:hypothetical protein
MWRLLILSVLLTSPALAQQASQLPSTNQSIVITTANTFQAITVSGLAMRSLTIENNNPPPHTNPDNCWIDITGLVTPGMTLSTMVTPPGRSAMTAERASIMLIPSEFYQRITLPHLPTGPITGTCDTAGDSIYVDWQ